MTMMNAAVVTSFDEPPRYQPFPVPAPAGGEVLADVLAAGLHPRVRSGAAGRHYTSSGELPMIPGIDGVGRLPDGRTVYFAAGDDVLGTMADKAVVDPRRSVELPDGTDVAKRLGAGRVVGAGRDPGRLDGLIPAGADEVVRLTDDPDATASALAAAAAETDIVIDYLWGKPAQQAIMALLTARGDRGRQLDWIQIGAVAGPTIDLPSVALRSANFRLQGSGQGSVSPRGYLAELPSLVQEITAGTITVRANVVPLSDVGDAWARSEI